MPSMETLLTQPNNRPGIIKVYRIPETVIDQVIVNPDLKRSSDANLVKWLDAGFLIRQAAVFALGVNEGVTSLPQPPTMRRGSLLKIIRQSKPMIDEYGTSYGQIGVKGSGISTEGVDYFAATNQAAVPFLPGEDSKYLTRTLLTATPIPLGYFGLFHSLQEMTVSNLFSGYGGRNGRVLGVLALNHDKFIGWLNGLLCTTPYPVLEMLQRVRKNGDQAAICVRLMGADRYADLRSKTEKGLFEPRAIIQRAARILLSELCSRGTKGFNSYYEFSSNSDYMEDLVAVESGHFTYGNFENYKALLGDFRSRNLSVKEKLSKRCFNSRLTIMIEDQDIDLTGMWYDWETSVPDTPGYEPKDCYPPYFKTQYSEFR